MMRRLLTLLTVTLVVASVTTARADVFFSGRIDMNASAAGGGGAVLQSNRSGQADGGASYNNVFGSGAGGASVAGNVIRSVGVTILSGGQQNNTPIPFNSGNNLVAIYALSGKIDNPGPVGAKANFQAESGGQGVVFIMDRSSGGTFDRANPATWANDINDLSNGRLAVLTISDIPTAVAAGSPGPPTTQVPAVGSLANLNTASIDLSLSFATSTPQFKFDIASLGSFFANPNVVPPPGDTNTILTSLAALLQLNQQLDSLTTPSLTLDAGHITELNTIFNQLIGGQFATGLGSNGSDYNPNPAAMGVNTGDAALFNTGGFDIPGGQFVTPQNEQVPEPASLAIWSLILSAGLGFGIVRQRRRKS